VRVDTASGPANLSIFFDITVRQAVEGALRRSEAMLSHLFATSPDCIALTDMATGRYAMVNAAFCRLTGFASEEVVGRTAAELGLWHDQHAADRLAAQLERNGTVRDLPAVFMTKAGAAVSMRLAAGRFVMDGHDYLVVNARDVTDSERTRLEHAAILEHASIGIAFTRDRRFVQANPCFERMFGVAPGGLIGQPGAAVWLHMHDYDDFDRIAGPLLAAGQPFEVEREAKRADGSTFWCRLLAQAVDRSDPSHGGTIWIVEDVTERRHLNQALAAARDAAEAASRAKSTFLANTSHEIRTPLNGLLGLARLAMQEDLLDARRQQYLAQILDSAQSLAGIMSDILDVSKIEAGKITLEDVAFDLREMLAAVHHAYQPLADVKGLALRLIVDAALPHSVRGDPVRVRQILSNFITNALKFTDHGEVRIEATVIAGPASDDTADIAAAAPAHDAPRPVAGVRLAVADTGPGIAAEDRERLFVPFAQGDSSTTRRFGGTGLGLSICRELARLMDGMAGVDSEVGAGSTFWVELPLPGATPAPAVPITGPGEISRLYGARVLMVEDNPVNMMIAVAMLEHWGVLVAQAFDGRAAVDAVHAAVQAGQPFDAVLMDVQMPVMGGHEAARELRLHYSAEVLPIIALTAAALVSERQEAFASGMNDFLTKPIDAPKFRDTLAQHVGRRRGVGRTGGAQ
jgi:PAS domain S-box-containing protein